LGRPRFLFSSVSSLLFGPALRPAPHSYRPFSFCGDGYRRHKLLTRPACVTKISAQRTGTDQTKKDAEHQGDYFMLNWLKEILGDNYSQEIDESVSKNIGKEFVPRAEFNKANDSAKDLSDQLAERDKQLEGLKDSGKTVEELQAEIAKQQELNKQQATDYKNKLDGIKRDSAIDAAITKAGAQNVKAVRALLGDLSDVKVNDDGVTGLSDKISSLKKDNGWAFKPDSNNKPSEDTGGVVLGNGYITGAPQGNGVDGLTGVEKAFFNSHPELAPKEK